MSIYSWIVGWLVWLSADPMALDLEAPKAAAAVAAAHASMLVDAVPAPAPKPPAPTPGVCVECKGTGYLVMPDGHRVKCAQCNGTGKPCPDGKCPPKKP
jgi:hypothetical protein